MGEGMDTSTDENIDCRWQDVNTLLRRSGPMAQEGFESNDSDNFVALRDTPLLIVGAGGLGCELLKDLALMGFRKMSVIDMDTIDATNLNRQFLFREADVGKPKAEVAAAFIEKRVRGVEVTPYFCKIQDQDDDFYRSFRMLVCGLDSIEARRWLNVKLHDLVEFDDDDEMDPASIIPMVDGGTEGFKGQARLIVPFMTACFECTLSMFPPQQAFPMCTIANTPRQPEHCIQYALIVLWNKEKPFSMNEEAGKVDTDNPQHMEWLFQKALQRAKEFAISGVTLKLTQGVVKRIIPAIASTNAVISAAESNEVFKCLSGCAQTIESYMMYLANAGVYTHTFSPEKREDCLVCGNARATRDYSGEDTLEDLLEHLRGDPEFQMVKPAVSIGVKPLYWPVMKSTHDNLEKQLKALFESGTELTVTSSSFDSALTLVINFL